jgi:terminase large subunit-like protein
MAASLASVSRRIAALERDRGSEPASLHKSAVEFAYRVGLDELDAWQQDLLLSEAPRILLNITRQGGKSTMSGVLAAHKALASPGALVLILAPSERQAKETFAKAVGLYRRDVPADSYRKLGMELRNGSRIEALPGTERTVRGYSGVDLLILDEAARIDDALYYTVRPILAVSGGRLLMMSTPYGKRGVF